MSDGIAGIIINWLMCNKHIFFFKYSCINKFGMTLKNMVDVPIIHIELTLTVTWQLTC